MTSHRPISLAALLGLGAVAVLVILSNTPDAVVGQESRPARLLGTGTTLANHDFQHQGNVPATGLLVEFAGASTSNVLATWNDGNHFSPQWNASVNTQLTNAPNPIVELLWSGASPQIVPGGIVHVGWTIKNCNTRQSMASDAFFLSPSVGKVDALHVPGIDWCYGSSELTPTAAASSASGARPQDGVDEYLPVRLINREPVTVTAVVGQAFVEAAPDGGPVELDDLRAGTWLTDPIDGPLRSADDPEVDLPPYPLAREGALVHTFDPSGAGFNVIVAEFYLPDQRGEPYVTSYWAREINTDEATATHTATAPPATPSDTPTPTETTTPTEETPDPPVSPRVVLPILLRGQVMMR